MSQPETVEAKLSGPKAVWAKSGLGQKQSGPKAVWAKSNLGQKRYGPKAVWAKSGHFLGHSGGPGQKRKKKTGQQQSGPKAVAAQAWCCQPCCLSPGSDVRLGRAHPITSGSAYETFMIQLVCRRCKDLSCHNGQERVVNGQTEQKWHERIALLAPLMMPKCPSASAHKKQDGAAYVLCTKAQSGNFQEFLTTSTLDTWS